MATERGLGIPFISHKPYHSRADQTSSLMPTIDDSSKSLIKGAFKKKGGKVKQKPAFSKELIFCRSGPPQWPKCTDVMLVAEVLATGTQQPKLVLCCS